MKKYLLAAFLFLTTLTHAQGVFQTPTLVISGSSSSAGGGGTTCPTYDSIGVLRQDSATFVIFCCAGGCDTFPLIASPGGGAVALWMLNGSSIVQVDTGYNVGTGITTPLGRFHAQGTNSRIIVSPIGFDDGAFLQYTDGGDTSFIVGVSPGDVYHRANVDGTDYDVILNLSDPKGTQIQGKDTATGNALVIFGGADNPFQGDTVAKFANAGTITFPDLAGSGIRTVTADDNGVLRTGTQAILYEEDTVESADVLNMRTSPIELIAAPGAGKAIQITQAIIVVLYNSVPYASNGNIRLLNGDNPQMEANGSSLQLSATRATVFSYDDLGIDNIAENYPIELSCGSANPTGGNSDVIIKIWYRIIDLQTDPY